MPWAGSRKSGDSTMLSCLSPRSPCWGPKAADNVTSSSAAIASSECVRSAVTDAGCASRATRRPLSGPSQLRFGQKPVDAELHHVLARSISRTNPAATVEVGFLRAVRERPVRHLSVQVLDDGREPDQQRAVAGQGEQRLERNDGLERHPVLRDADRDARRCRIGERDHPVAIGREAVRGPLGGRREIELAVGKRALSADEGLEAGVLPQPVRLPRLGGLRQGERVHVTVEKVPEPQAAVRRGPEFDVDVTHGRGRRRRVTHEGDAAWGEAGHPPIIPGPEPVSLERLEQRGIRAHGAS